MKYILGEKQKMSQIFTQDAKVVPVTPVHASPVIVTQVKTQEKDGYNAIQVGYGTQKKHRINKAQQGHSKDLGDFRYYKEIRLDAPAEVKVGDSIDLSNFEEGEKVQVTSTSKSKGFQGVVKRHGFAGGRRSHGQKHEERAPGSIGATGPQRVFKGVRMAGRMGGDRVTVSNLKVAKVDAVNNMIYIKGAVPGVPGALVEIQSK